MNEKICNFANDYSEIPRLTLGLSLVDDTLRAANHLLWRRGIAFRLEVPEQDNQDPLQEIVCSLTDYPAGPLRFGATTKNQAA
jgi:hypothetical protein